MTRFDRVALAAVSAAALAAGSLVAGSSGAEAKQCWRKVAIGTAFDEASARFQVDEALLQSVDWGAWAAWMATGTTPGYQFGARSYKCSKGGGLEVTCRGQATICKL